MNAPAPGTSPAAAQPQVACTQILYVLHATSVVVGVVMLLAGLRSLLFALPSVIAIAVNFLLRAQVRGSWLDSHFAFQLRSFSWALFWSVMATLAFGSFVLIITPIPLLQISALVIAAWFTWRLGLGWLALRAGRAAPDRADARIA